MGFLPNDKNPGKKRMIKYRDYIAQGILADLVID
jgi:hypothetical protein